MTNQEIVVPTAAEVMNDTLMRILSANSDLRDGNEVLKHGLTLKQRMAVSEAIEALQGAMGKVVDAMIATVPEVRS